MKQPEIATDASRPVALAVGDFAAAVDAAHLPARTREVCYQLMIDVAGLCVAARQTDYIRACLATVLSNGSATAIGHLQGVNAYDAALINGTAAHGEDFDDTFEGGPVHAGAVIVPAVLAAAEQRNLDGRAVMKGLAAGVEVMCRMSLVAPQAMHRAGFHPTAVIGALAGAVGVGAAIGLDAKNRSLNGNCRLTRIRHNRISRRWKLDQTTTCRSSRASRTSCRLPLRSRLCRSGHGA